MDCAYHRLIATTEHEPLGPPDSLYKILQVPGPVAMSMLNRGEVTIEVGLVPETDEREVTAGEPAMREFR